MATHLSYGSRSCEMMVLITYDVSTEAPGGKARLRKVARQCVNYGQRVQNSVFECLLEPAQFVTLRAKLEGIINPDIDSIRYYFLGANWSKRVEHVGVLTSYTPEGVIIVD